MNVVQEESLSQSLNSSMNTMDNVNSNNTSRFEIEQTPREKKSCMDCFKGLCDKLKKKKESGLLDSN